MQTIANIKKASNDVGFSVDYNVESTYRTYTISSCIFQRGIKCGWLGSI
jgi:hypothetical protein